ASDLDSSPKAVRCRVDNLSRPYRVSGVRIGEDLSSFNSSCSARRQNSSSRPSGCPFCSHSLYALAAISLSLGLAINVSPTMGPPLGFGGRRPCSGQAIGDKTG